MFSANFFNMTKATSLVSKLILGGCLALLATSTSFAQTTETTINKTLSLGESYSHEQYAVPGVKLNLTYQYKELVDTTVSGTQIYATGEGHATLTCGNGEWNLNIPSNETQICMNKIVIPCYYRGKRNEDCTVTIPEDQLNTVDVSAIDEYKCSGTACAYLNEASKYKTSGNVIITSDNEKDRFKMENGQTAFFEYNLGGSKKLVYIDATGQTKYTTDAAEYLIPWGPISGSKQNTDFDQFVEGNSGTSSGLLVQYACPPVKVTLCENTTTSNFNRVNGACGDANGADFGSKGEIPTNNLCRLGRATSISGPDSNYKFHWTCKGAGAGTSSTSCYANQSLDGTCGSAHRKKYTSSSQIPNAGKCSIGTPSAIQGPTAGPWLWTCSGIGAGNASETCIGENSNYECGPVKNVIYIMDDSGSMSGSRMTNAKASMRSTLKQQIEHKQKYDTSTTKIGMMGLNRVKSPSWINYWGGSYHSFSEAGAATTAWSNGKSIIDNYYASGGTPLWARVIEAAKILGSGDANRSNYIIAFSDGASSGSDSDALKTLNSYPYLHMHAVDLSSNNEFKSVATRSGGLYAQASNATDLAAVTTFFAVGCEN